MKRRPSLTLNRPDRRNALTIELMEALCGALESLAGEPRRRVVILRGAGPAFCAGLDLHEAAETDFAKQSAVWVARTFQTLAASPLVTIAAVHGAAYARRGRPDGVLRLRRRGRGSADLLSRGSPRAGAGPGGGRARDRACATAISANCCCWASRSMPRGPWQMGLVRRVVPADGCWPKHGRSPRRS